MKKITIKAIFVLSVVVTIIFQIGNATASNAMPPDEWLVESDGNTTENYYLTDEEKSKKIVGPWKEFNIFNRSAKINFPWEPNFYEMPNNPRARSTCSKYFYIVNITNSLNFNVMEIYCKELGVSDFELKRRYKSAFSSGLKNRKLFYEKKLKLKLKLKRGMGGEFLVKDSYGYYILSRAFLYKKTSYLLSISSKNKEEVLNPKYVTNFLDSLKIIMPNKEFKNVVQGTTRTTNR